jgi:hypothetical protein
VARGGGKWREVAWRRGFGHLQGVVIGMPIGAFGPRSDHERTRSRRKLQTKVAR